MRPARRADSSAVIVVPNVRAKMKAPHYIPALSLLTCYGNSLLFTFTARLEVKSSAFCPHRVFMRFIHIIILLYRIK